MSRQFFFLILSLVLLGGATTSWAVEGDSLWWFTYGDRWYDNAYSIVASGDGGFLLAGRTAYGPFGSPYVYLIKINDCGDTLWSNTYGEGWANGITPAGENGFLLAGRTWVSETTQTDFYLVRVSSQGDRIWLKTYGTAYTDEATAVISAGDGGFLIAGYSDLAEPNGNDMALLKVDAQGDSLWFHNYGGDFNDMAFSIAPSVDGGFLLAGYTGSFGGGWYQMYLVKVNAQGDELWHNTYGGAGDDRCFSIIPSGDGGFLLAGTNSSYSQMYLVKVNSEGDELWSHTYGGSGMEYAYSIIPSGDGGFLLAGGSTSYSPPEYQMYLVKVNAQGDELWSNIFGGFSSEGANSITPTVDGNFLLAGFTFSFGAGNCDIFLVCAEGPDIILSNTLLDFGSVMVSQQRDLPLTIYNFGTDTLAIYGVACSLPVFATDFNQADSLVLPGDSIELMVRFRPADALFYADTMRFTSNCTICSVLLWGQGTPLVGITEESQSPIITEFALYYAYPNPFNGTTVLSFELPKASMVRLEVFDVNGRSVGAHSSAPLSGSGATPTLYPAGTHEITFDGSGLPSGVYYYRLTAGANVASGKMMLMK